MMLKIEINELKYAQVFEQAAVKKPGGRSLNRKNQLLKGLRLGKGKRDFQSILLKSHGLNGERLGVQQSNVDPNYIFGDMVQAKARGANVEVAYP
ncbi:hypothetical protein QL285_094166 [Trifolium repens]|nr:hypothetical protein QL285_094166 [Trifolium repens]